MAPNTDAVVADVRHKRLAIDQRIDALHDRIQRLNPKRLPWQSWTARAWPFVAPVLVAWLWRRYRYRHRFMRLP